MRHGFLRATIAAAALALAAGCTTSERPARQGEVGRDVERAWESVKSYSYDQKQDFERRMEATLNEFDRDIDAWKARSREVTSDLRSSYDQAIEDLRRGKEDVRAKFDQVRVSTRENWEDVKESFRRAMADLEHSFDRAAAKFR